MLRANAQMRASTGSLLSLTPEITIFSSEVKTTEDRVKDRDQILENLLFEIEEMKNNSSEENDEHLWKIMSRLEDIKREYEDILNDNRYQSANGVFQKKLAEIKAALLPLLSTSDQQQSVPEEEQETENEIARFSEDFRLVLTTQNWERFSKVASKTHISNVISICGDTHVGKSTLIASLLSTEPGQVTPEVAQPQQNSPTTANVNCYDHPNFSSALGSVRLLDLEGENGGKPPKTAICTKLLALLDTMGVTEYQEGRRKAVAENLARLAFVVSDVVVYVWNESFANASYMKRVKQLAHDSTEGVDSATSPCLILVYNKCSLDEQFDIEKCTAEFFENVENLEIKNFYSEVKRKCVCIPHKDQMKKVRMAGKSTHYIDGEEIYALQIRKLADLLSDMMCKRMQQREANGCLFSESVWCILFKLVIERFHKKLRMGEILSNIMKPKHYLSSKAQTYDMGGSFRPKEFLQCREAAVQMLACLCVDHLKNKQEQFDKFIMNTLKSEACQSQSRLMLADLLSHIGKMAPCEAVYPGSFVEGNSEPILCTQEKICHSVVHRTSHRINIPSSSGKKITRLFENFQYWVGVGYRPTWEGTHVIQYPIDDADISDLFLDEIEFLSHVLPGNYFLTRVSILQKALHFAVNRKAPNYSDICWICLDHIANRKLDNCAHVFCIHCIEKLYSSHSNQVPVEVNAKQEEESGFIPRIKNNQCPICYKVFHGTSPIEISSRSLVKLSEKFNYIFEY